MDKTMSKFDELVTNPYYVYFTMGVGLPIGGYAAGQGNQLGWLLLVALHIYLISLCVNSTFRNKA
jgi:hypothetical protein